MCRGKPRNPEKIQRFILTPFSGQAHTAQNARTRAYDREPKTESVTSIECAQRLSDSKTRHVIDSRQILKDAREHNRFGETA